MYNAAESTLATQQEKYLSAFLWLYAMEKIWQKLGAEVLEYK